MVSASSPTWTIKMKQRCWSNEWLLRTPPEWNYFSHFPSLDIFLLPGWSSVWLLLVFINFHSIQKSSEAGQENSRTGGRKEDYIQDYIFTCELNLYIQWMIHLANWKYFETQDLTFLSWLSRALFYQFGEKLSPCVWSPLALTKQWWWKNSSSLCLIFIMKLTWVRESLK